MKELLPGSDTLANRISFFHIALLLLSLPFDQFYSHLILISLCVHTLIQLKKGNIKPVLTTRVSAIQAVFFIAMIATIYTKYPQQAFAEWGREVVIFIIPLIFCFNAVDVKRYLPPVLFIFAIGCTLTVVYLFASVFITIAYYNIPLKSIFTPAFTSHNFSQPIAIHATFFSLQLVMALVAMVYYLLNFKTSWLLKIIYAICSLILLAGLVQLGSKSILITTFLIFAFVFPYCLAKGKKRLRFIAVAACIIIITSGAILTIPTFRDKYINDMQTDLSPLKSGQNSEPRLARWEAIVAVIKASPIIGYGSGSEIMVLGNAFYANKLYDSYTQKLNAHNQYLSFMLKSGLWGLIAYLAVLVYGFRTALKNEDVLFISFMMLIAIVSISENILDMDKGVFFYGFFFSLFLFSSAQKNNKKRKIICRLWQPIKQ